MIDRDGLSDHDLLVRIDERVETIQLRLADGDRRMERQGQRISKLERWRAYIAGALAALTLVLGLLQL